MTAEDILEQICEVLDDDMVAAAKVHRIKDIIQSEAKDTPFATARAMVWGGR